MVRLTSSMRSIASAALSTSPTRRSRGAVGTRGAWQAGTKGNAERRQFRADPLSRRAGTYGPRRRCIPDPPRPDPAAARALSSAGCAAAHGRQRGGQSFGRRSSGAIHGCRVSEQVLFERLALIGTGLIGSSSARAARPSGAARSIIATARSPATRRRVAELELADEVTDTNAAAVNDADLVILCVPVGQCGAVAAEIGPHLKAGAIVSDVGSVKSSVLRDMAPHLPAGVHFVPAHPVAGTEHSGPDAGFAELFVNRWCILTPPDNADPAAVERLSAFWRALGANVGAVSAEAHCRALAITGSGP